MVGSSSTDAGGSIIDVDGGGGDIGADAAEEDMMLIDKLTVTNASGSGFLIKLGDSRAILFSIPR